MKKYVKISNKGVIQHREILEFIGLGTKRCRPDDGVSIGQWQSGFKLATPAAMRLGIEVVASSSDASGPFILRFQSRRIIPSSESAFRSERFIRYVYSDGVERDITVAINAFPEFDKPIGDDTNAAYPVLREYIANARDEDVDFRIETNVPKIRQAPRGHTVIFIEQSREILEMLAEKSIRYFKFLDEAPLFSVPGLGAIYPKSEKGKTRFFNHGYLVGCKNDDDLCNSCFDYDIFGKDIINEMRWIKDEHVFKKRLAELFCRIDDYAILRTVIDFAEENPFADENSVFGYADEKDMSDNFKELCRQVWNDKFGKHAYIKCGKAFIDANAETMGFGSVSIGYNLNNFFKKVGIMTTEEAIQNKLRQISIREPSALEQARIYSIMERYLLRIKYYRAALKFAVKISRDPSATFLGVAERYREICIDEKQLEENDGELLLVYIHELRHCMSKLDDANFRRFMNYADREIKHLLELLALALNKLEKNGIKPSEICGSFADIK